MDLFSSANYEVNRAAISDHLSEYWVHLYEPDAIAALRDTMDKVYMEILADTCYPPWPDIFKAFNTMYPQEVRVVILGQDPYYNGNATGLAFACRQSLSPSLEAIVWAIKRNFPDLYIPDGKPRRADSDMSLMHLVRQGVLLLNTALTVEQGKPGSHANLWNDFTAATIKVLNKRPKLIWMLWGGHAKQYQSSINPNHTVLTAEHPAAAARANRDWMCDNFKDANKELNPPIIWF